VVRVLLDAHFSPRRVGDRLTAAGHDVLAIAAAPAYAGLPDEQVLELATAEARVLVTGNAKDFDRITRRWASLEHAHAGVLLVWTRETDEFGSLVKEIVATLERVGEQEAWADLVLAI
jgi:Domain of unknown function (DUF5615)